MRQLVKIKFKNPEKAVKRRNPRRTLETLKNDVWEAQVICVPPRKHEDRATVYANPA